MDAHAIEVVPCETDGRELACQATARCHRATPMWQGGDPPIGAYATCPSQLSTAGQLVQVVGSLAAAAQGAALHLIVYDQSAGTCVQPKSPAQFGMH